MWIFFSLQCPSNSSLSITTNLTSMSNATKVFSIRLSFPPLLAHFITFLGRVLSVIVWFEGG